jgi:hypothetical protein
VASQQLSEEECPTSSAPLTRRSTVPRRRLRQQNTADDLEAIQPGHDPNGQLLMFELDDRRPA